MSEETKIEWATSTGNPWIGCSKVSPGCKNCYAAELDANRFSRTMGGGTKENPVSHWGPGAPRFRTKGFWKDAVKWNETLVCDTCNQSLPILPTEKLDGHVRPIGNSAATRCTGQTYHRPRIFPSLCDWLDEEVPIEWLADFLKLIHDTPNLDWLLLTKRPELWSDRLHSALNADGLELEHEAWISGWLDGIAPSNVWIGASVEDRPRTNRIEQLRAIPANIRFVSFEPLLEELGILNLHGIHWAIPGGESGRHSRDCYLEWLWNIVEQCQAQNVRCFVKQVGKVSLCSNANLLDFPDDAKLIAHGQGAASCRFITRHPKGGDWLEWPDQIKVRQFPA